MGLAPESASPLGLVDDAALSQRRWKSSALLLKLQRHLAYSNRGIVLQSAMWEAFQCDAHHHIDWWAVLPLTCCCLKAEMIEGDLGCLSCWLSGDAPWEKSGGN